MYLRSIIQTNLKFTFIQGFKKMKTEILQIIQENPFHFTIFNTSKPLYFLITGVTFTYD